MDMDFETAEPDKEVELDETGGIEEDWRLYQSLPVLKSKSRFLMFQHFLRSENILSKLPQLKNSAKLLGIEEYNELCDEILRTVQVVENEWEITADMPSFDRFFTTGFRTSALSVNCKTSRELAPGEPCDGCLKTQDQCQCKLYFNKFIGTMNTINQNGIKRKYMGPMIYKVITTEMQRFVELTCIGKYEDNHLSQLLHWVDMAVIPWLARIYYSHLDYESKVAQALAVNRELQKLLHQIFGKCIIDQIFSVCIDYPDSLPILEDLAKCLNRIDLRSQLVTKLKKDSQRRLLNPGVNTTDVLEAYVATVRSLKFLDSSGILVQLVTPPIREYLKKREETVRVILVSLTEESGELSDELAKNPTQLDPRQKLEITWRTWQPDPKDVPKDKSNLRKADLIQTLISIYGSKSLFIDEYRALLADRLLKMGKPGSITREIKCLELLKLRFGEADLQKCEVMLKDVSDSQRMNTRFHEESIKAPSADNIPVSALIVSAQFWPTFKQDTLNLPEEVTNALGKYTRAFEMVKGNRSLEWQKHIGTVELELEHANQKVVISCTPPQAVFIWHFQEKDTWNLDELTSVTGMNVSALRSRALFWVGKGILVHGKQDVFHLNENFNSESTLTSGCLAHKYVEDDDLDNPMTSASAQRETELQMFWSYIEGMLQNLDTLPLTRIHSMLKLFATVECSSEELQKFLDQKVSQGLLVFSSGQYQLTSKSLVSAQAP